MTTSSKNHPNNSNENDRQVMTSGNATDTETLLTAAATTTSKSTNNSSTSTILLLSNACGSALASIFSRLCTHPLDTIKARIQVLNTTTTTNATSTTTTIRNTYYNTLYSTIRNEGILSLYRGLGIVVIGGTPGTMIYLCTYDIFKERFTSIASTTSSVTNNNTSSNNNFVIHFISGMVAETIACIIYVPVDVIKERMQVQQQQQQQIATITNRHPNQVHPPTTTATTSTPYYYRNGYDALRQIIQKEGIYHGIYRGYGATLASFGPFSALYFVFYEYFKNTIYQNQKRFMQLQQQPKLQHESSYIDIPFQWTVLCAASAGGLASFITSPLDMAKLRLQVQRGGMNASTILQHDPKAATSLSKQSIPYKGMMDCLQQTYRIEGLRGLFRGAGARVLHFAPATTVTMTLYETCRKNFETFFIQMEIA